MCSTIKPCLMISHHHYSLLYLGNSHESHDTGRQEQLDSKYSRFMEMLGRHACRKLIPLTIERMHDMASSFELASPLNQPLI
jgi:hypothetical protein